MSQASACFVCGPPAPPVAPWRWPSPRVLCSRHRRVVRLSDGQDLGRILARVAHAGGRPAEGSLLGCVYNPVSVEIDGAPPVRAWADFAAGGMAVLEDHPAAADYFDWAAVTRGSALDVLHALRLASTAKATPVDAREEMALLLDAAALVPPEKDRYVDHVYGFGPGLTFLSGLLGHQLELSRIQATHARLWPESLDELERWLSSGGEAMRRPGADVGSLLSRLRVLAQRRFPVPCRVAAAAG